MLLSLQISGEVLMSVLQRCGLASQRPTAGASAVVDGALSVVLGGQWPPAASASTQPFKSFEGIFEALSRSPGPAISAASRDPLHQVQQFLITDRLAGLATHVYRWLVARDGTASGGQYDDPEAQELDGGRKNAGEDEEDPAGLAGLPPRHFRMVAFAAHLLLLLEGLGGATLAADLGNGGGALEHAK